LTSGDVELLEHAYPIIIRRYSLMTDSGGAGKFRGGSGTCWEVEPIDKPMTFVMFGEGRRLPAMGAAGAHSNRLDSKVGRVEFTRAGDVETVRKNVIATIQPGETAANKNPGGGGYGDPFERPVEKVVWDVKNDLVSIQGAVEDYGVVIRDSETLEVDSAATQKLRGNRTGSLSTHTSRTIQKTPPPAPVRASRSKVQAAEAPSPANERPALARETREPEHLPRAPVPLTGADVGYIKIVDFDKERDQERKGKRDIKIRYF
jgi:hypothetical protein